MPPPTTARHAGPAHAPRWAVLPIASARATEPAVRDWLGRQLGVPATALPITRDGRGRPQLGLDGFDCNWSHSGDRFGVALGQGLRVGIDIEREHARPRALELARRFFCREEAEWLAALPATARDRAFLRLWCGKEAILKAHGHGLSFGLHRLRLEERDGRLALLECDAALGDRALWQLQELVPAPGYLGALAWRPLGRDAGCPVGEEAEVRPQAYFSP